MAATTPKVKLDDFIKKIRPSASGDDALVFIQGYIADSPTRGSVRVYLDPSLNTFIDIPQKDIVHSIPAKDDPHGLGGSKLWVKLPQPADNTSAAFEFTQGDLFNDYLQKIYTEEAKKPGSISPTRNPTLVFGSDVIVPYNYDGGPVLASDFTIPAPTEEYATDFTRPQLATDITKVFRRRWRWATDITRFKTFGITRGCPLGTNRMGNTGGYY